jgi:predicted TIM-barrel fold metal-dependent hydrolase
MANACGRRAFLKLAVTAAAGAQLRSVVSGSTDSSSGRGPADGAPGRGSGYGGQARPPRRFIIDSHQHFDDRPDYFDKLVATYRPRNAMACVLTPMPGFEATKRAATAYPDVVIPYGQISVDDTAAPDQIAKFADAGFKGIKMHSPQRNWDDPQYFHLYRQIQDRKLVALFHTGIAFHIETPQYTSMARMRPAYLDTIARAFPELYIQGAHLGNPWYEEAAEVTRWGPRVYFDVTGSSLIKKAKNLAVFKEYLWWEGPTAHSSPQAVYAFEKLVFGTDEAPEQIDNMLGRYEALLDACAVPEPSRRKIFAETMARILGIPVRT